MEPSVSGNTANFSSCVRAGDFLYVSGQASLDADGQIWPGTFAEEMVRSVRAVERILVANDATLRDVVKVGAYLQNPSDLGEYNATYQDLFAAPLPARTTLVGCLGDLIKFEIDVVAYVPQVEGAVA